MPGKKVLLVIAPKNFRDEELFHTKEELEKAGFQTSIASSSLSEAVGMLGGKAKPEILLEKAKAEDFDAVAFIGGGGAASYFNNRFALSLAQKFYNAGKITAAICIAPVILANAGLLNGKKATSFPSEENALEDKGAAFTGNPVEADGLIVTAEGPKAARDFGKKIAQLLK
ncbi:MAG: DJ-1/PfpI family protein [Candidatus Diapherotrites archaeon]|uniref:DJ-1/PfpI family protein n=1 Tax=Candidatus Iainarchaeum sp. TaxID=3101447 RepID=A0A7J4JW37_9ARCH|nr:MAG: protease I [archaeon GW2011_AR21]MBS3058022.1 DJ-1/PfpI family protein [Candidatus Diapherotrites archaeon]HIH21981.1 DJ-1/PfpI family protein [Candidatus Diapherotrites archaeon]HIH32625.1 DJ-1/PfpI family protein [Candidatus Diapherotrites archaeon]